MTKVVSGLLRGNFMRIIGQHTIHLWIVLSKVSHAIGEALKELCVEGPTIRPTLGGICGKEGTLRIWSCQVITLVTNLKIILESVLARIYILCCPYRRTLY